MKNQKLVQSITSRDQDFAQWYTDLCVKAELMDYSAAKGFIIYRPLGYALWEGMQTFLNQAFKETGHQNVYMPMLINESLFMKEAEHVEGFAPETAIVTHGGKEELTERLIIRPTSEVLFCEHYSKIVTSYRDLPKLYNQWCSVVRWEKTTRPFLRGKEFLWQEGHTAHANEEEARKEALDILAIYERLGKELLAIPFVTGIKTEREKFAGAEETYSIEALMHDGKALQSGTTHYFGQGFAEAFNITFQDKDSKIKHVYQTSWGVSTRLIGAVIMVHGDDEGLVLPPYLAPEQVVVLPIQMHKEGVKDAAQALFETIKAAGIRTMIDDSDRSPGWKFSEYEMKGVPLRVEVGPRDLENNQCTIVRRDTREKIQCALDDVATTIQALLKTMHDDMYQRALNHVQSKTKIAENYEEFKTILDTEGGYVQMSWCGDESCEIKVKEDTTATSRVIPFEQGELHDDCDVCGKKAKLNVLFAKAY